MSGRRAASAEGRAGVPKGLGSPPHRNRYSGPASLFGALERPATTAKRSKASESGHSEGLDSLAGERTLSKRLIAIIATLGRPGQVALLLRHLERQSRLPDEVILSAPDESHLSPAEEYRFPVSRIFGARGLTAQRNVAVEDAKGRCDVITFFDDDFVPADDYLERVCEAFDSHADWAVVFGEVFRDGVTTAGISWEEGVRLVADDARNARHAPVPVEHVGAYGCNMSIRTDSIGPVRFDERLVLSGWQEDIDFTSQLRRKGKVINLNTLRGVHLGVKGGRVSGVRCGYSQIANPLYLIRKGTMPLSFALKLMARNMLANAVRSIRPEPYIDRRGRLRGNLLCLLHVAAGRDRPEFILEI